MECKNIGGCPFFNCCEELKQNTSVQGFMVLYCKGAKMSECIRLRLGGKFGKGVVPPNMMPNGMAVPGTAKDGWSDEAKNFRSVL